MQWWESLEDGALSDRYRIERKLGEGGMAEVFLARQEPLGRKVAIKFPKVGFDESPHLLRRFKREVERQDQERIVGVIGLLDAGERVDSDGHKHPYLVMEYVSGGSLADMLGGRFGARLHRQSIDDVMVWLPPIAATLDRLHGRGLLHRDVKPDNILFNADGDPLLADFGIATSLDDAQSGSEGSSTSLWVVGSPGYMSPEIMASEKAASSDQFSLGITVYEALTGRLPMVPQNLGAWMKALANWHPEHLSNLCPDLPQGVADAVMKAISSEGKERFASCTAFANRVRDARAEKPDAQRPAHDATAFLPPDHEPLAARRIQEGWRYVAGDGKQQGPVSQPALRTLYANGSLLSTSLIWATGMTQWREYSSIFTEDVPPPVPSPSSEHQAALLAITGEQRLAATGASGEQRIAPMPMRVEPPPVPVGVSGEQRVAPAPAGSGPPMVSSTPGHQTGAFGAGGTSERMDAGLGMRFAARIIDTMIFIVAMLPIFAAYGAAAQDPNNPQLGALSLFGLLCLLLLTVVQGILIGKSGQSLGKKAIGIRIVLASDGSNPGFVRAFLVRELIYGLISYLSTPLLGVPLLIDVVPVFGADRRCLHDYLAGTRVSPVIRNSVH